MFALGQDHRWVPRDPDANVAFRLQLYQAMREDARLVQGVKELCRRDILFYINSFVWQFNPRKEGVLKTGPFCTWPVQETAVAEILGAIAGQHDLVIEKSRDMGASWLCLLCFEWLWHFYPWNKFLCISRSEFAVERADDPDSLFWKIDFIHRYQPRSLLPAFRRRKGSFTNEDNQSSITGQASTGRAGVSGRATGILLDEFGHVEEDSEMLDRTTDTADCRIFNSTHVGTGTAFYRITVGGMKKLVMHWTQHPEKRQGLYAVDPATAQVIQHDKSYPYPPDYGYVTDGSPLGGPFPGLRSPWYDAQCGRKSSARAIAMDLDIDPQGSVRQFFSPLLVSLLKAKDGCEPLWQGDLDFDGDRGLPRSLVALDAGPLKLWVKPGADSRLPPGRYGIGADVSSGSGATPSCLSIVNNRGEKVGEYTNANIHPELFARLMMALGRLCVSPTGEVAWLCWEKQGPGVVVTKWMIEMRYPNVYYQTDDLKMHQAKSDKPGWNPTAENKRLLLEEYGRALERRQFVNHSAEALSECLQFQYTMRGTVEHSLEATGNADPAGARSNHGDHVIADALAWKMVVEYTGYGAGLASVASEQDVLKFHPGTLTGRRWLAEQQRRDEEEWA